MLQKMLGKLPKLLGLHLWVRKTPANPAKLVIRFPAIKTKNFHRRVLQGAQGQKCEIISQGFGIFVVACGCGSCMPDMFIMKANSRENRED